MEHLCKKEFIRQEDCDFFENELDSFVPDRVFDAHAHLCHPDFLDMTIQGIPKSFGRDEFFYWIDCLHPGREVAAYFLPFVWPYTQNCNISASNAWVSQHTSTSKNCYGALYVRAQDDPEWVRQEVKRLGLKGLKCYYSTAQIANPWEAELPEYLPEPLVRVADQEGWVITVHLVKSKAVADPGNIYWIRKYCKSFPNMKLILAHSARGFQPGNNLEGLGQLVGLENLFFDTSANCECFAHEVVLKLFGYKKLLYGSDSPICSHLRGKNFGVGNGFIWITEDSHKEIWEQGQPNSGKPVLLGLEHLRALKWASWSAGLKDSEIEDIFWNNALRLFV